VPRYQEAAALGLAMCSLLLGLVDWEPDLPFPRGMPSDLLSLKALSMSLWPILAGAALAVLLGRWGPGQTRDGNPLLAMAAPIRRSALPFARAIERIDATLRQWPVAGTSLLISLILFALALVAGR